MNRRSLIKGIVSAAAVAAVPVQSAVHPMTATDGRALGFTASLFCEPGYYASSWKYGYDKDDAGVVYSTIWIDPQTGQKQAYANFFSPDGRLHGFSTSVSEASVDDEALKRVAEKGLILCAAAVGVNARNAITPDESPPPAPDSVDTETPPALPDHDSTLAV